MSLRCGMPEAMAFLTGSLLGATYIGVRCVWIPLREAKKRGVL